MKKRRVPILELKDNTRHVWSLKHIKRSEQKDYVIEGLDLLDAVKLYKETRDDKYVAHIFFANFGYFVNTITRTLSRFGEVFRYSEAADYVGEAYIAVKEALDRFDFSKSEKVLSYLSGAIFYHIRKLIQRQEVKNWKNLDGLVEEVQNEHNDYEVLANMAYKEQAKALYNPDALNNSMILQEIYEAFKEDLAKVGINSVDDIFKLYGSLKGLTPSERSFLLRLRRNIKVFVKRRFGSL